MRDLVQSISGAVPGCDPENAAQLSRRLILVTGAPRSSTTIVGRQLSKAKGAALVYEPMNGDSGDKCITNYFEVPGRGGFQHADFEDFIKRLSCLKLRLKPGVFKHETGLRRVAKHLWGGQSRQSLRQARQRRAVYTLIWKDPLAAFAARAAVSRFELPVVVTYRPPEAVVASYKRLNWAFPTQDVAERLGKSSSEDAAPLSVVEGGARLWALIYEELGDLARRYPDKVHIVSAANLAKDPQGCLMRLYTKLELIAGWRAERAFAGLSKPRARPTGNKPPTGHPHSRNRDTRHINTYWQNVLSDEEVGLVGHHTVRSQTAFEALPKALWF